MSEKGTTTFPCVSRRHQKEAGNWEGFLVNARLWSEKLLQGCTTAHRQPQKGAIWTEVVENPSCAPVMHQDSKKPGYLSWTYN